MPSLIALSRVVVTAHYPSDVVAGAIVGAIGALLVRDWFAARRLGFAVERRRRRAAAARARAAAHLKAVARRLHSA